MTRRLSRRRATLTLATPVLATVTGLARPARELARQASPTAPDTTVVADVPVPAALVPATGLSIATLSRRSLAVGEQETVEGATDLGLYVVETGTVQVRFAGPALLVGGSGAGTPIANDTVTLPTGAAFLLPGRSGLGLANPGPAPASVLAVVLFPPGGGAPATPATSEGAGLSGATTWQLLAVGEVVTALIPTHVSVERVLAPAGAALGTLDVSGVGMLAVERGALGATVRQGFAQATSAVVLRTGAVGPGAVSVLPGKRRVVRDGGRFSSFPERRSISWREVTTPSPCSSSASTRRHRQPRRQVARRRRNPPVGLKHEPGREGRARAGRGGLERRGLHGLRGGRRLGNAALLSVSTWPGRFGFTAGEGRRSPRPCATEARPRARRC